MQRWAGLGSFGALGKNPFLPFLASRNHLHSLDEGPVFVFQANISLSLTLLPPSYKGRWDDTESPGTPGSAPTPSATSRPLCHTKLQDQDGASLGGISP